MSATSTSQRPDLEQAPMDADCKIVRHQVVVVGGGTAGISVAARLTNGWFNRTDVAIIDPAKDHFYQPAWTLVGGGAFNLSATRRDEASVIPARAKWYPTAVTEFDPEHNRIFTQDGTIVEYEFLVVAAGIQLNWHAIKGLEESLGEGGVCSNYSYQTVGSTWDSIRNFQGGTAIFTHPATPIKCGGAPQKICYLAEEHFRKSGVRDKSRVIFAIAAPELFAVEKYRKVLETVAQRQGVEVLLDHELVAVSSDTKEAIFRRKTDGEEVSIGYDMIHVTPPQGPPKFIAQSPLADAAGWVDVDRHTLQHVRYPNVFGLGDCANLPTSKTGAAIRKQAPVAAANLRAALLDQPLPARYDGYTSCPLVTGYGKLVLAEFGYDKQPSETFPFDQGKERWSMWLLKKYLLPVLYWQGMLKGRA